MVYAFSRDGGLPYSTTFSHVNRRFGIPLNALCLTTLVTLLFGCIFLVSSSAFNAISSASVIALSISYAMPIAIHCARGRDQLPARHFTLPNKLGWIVNLIGVVYSISTSVLFLLPPSLPVTWGNMNYGVVALVFVILFSAITWITHGRRSYRGPAMLHYVQVPDREDFQR
jgi:choline transport protein